MRITKFLKLLEGVSVGVSRRHESWRLLHILELSRYRIDETSLRFEEGGHRIPLQIDEE